MAKTDAALRRRAREREAATGARIRVSLGDLYAELAEIRAEAQAIESDAFGSDDEHARFWVTRAKQLSATLARAQDFLAKARHVADEMDSMAERETREDEVRAIGLAAAVDEKTIEGWVARNWTPDRARKFVEDLAR